MTLPVRTFHRIGWRCLLLAFAACRGFAQSATDGVDFFERRIRPVLVEHCQSCHGADKQKGGLRLDSAAAIRAGGENGVVIVPGHPESSRLLLAVGRTDADLKMPPKKALGERLVADLAEWVKRGAAMPADAPVVAGAAAGAEFTVSEKDRAHWSFQPILRPVPPVRSGTHSSPANPIDAFVLARLDAKGLEPNPPATKRELLRRATYDLTGLPPSPAEAAAFLADDSPLAWERVVDRLLASPRYGEKWGRHWLDLVRFAESNSYEQDAAKPHAWRFRDYVIRAFNADKPYDRFVREQLAGDELPDADDDAVIATGFHRVGIWDGDPADKELARYDNLDDLVATIGQVFLGLTVDCARCHNHKIDPIPQRDYYRLLAFVHNTTPYENAGAAVEVPLPSNPAEKALAITEPPGAPAITRVLLRGNPTTPGERVEPGFPKILGGETPTIPPIPAGAKSSGRRTLLADWIVSKANPLPARVLANRIWQYHFGRGLVRSPNNLGLQGDAPTHPELLDWLAAELVAQGWRMKPIHRLILLSDAYRRSSHANAGALARDPANDSFWRFDMRRLSAEEIRDTILSVSGTLNPRMSGPGIFVEIPKEVLAGQSVPGNGWGSSPPAEQSRRSIYIHAKRSLLTPILESFDVAETDRSTAVRFVTVQPTQALGMLNGKFLNQQAALFAARLRRESPDDPRAQVRGALRLVASREPTSAEIERGLRLVGSLQTEDHASPELALERFCLMALNMNEMVFLD